MFTIHHFVVGGKRSPILYAADILKLAGLFPDNPAIIRTQNEIGEDDFEITVDDARHLREDMEEYKARQNGVIDSTKYHADVGSHASSSLEAVFGVMLPFLERTLDASTNGK